MSKNGAGMRGTGKKNNWVMLRVALRQTRGSRIRLLSTAAVEKNSFLNWGSNATPPFADLRVEDVRGHFRQSRTQGSLTSGVCL